MRHANETQVGGRHYLKGGAAQHWDWVEANGLGYLEGNATKYVTRWRSKNGRQDLEKARHYVRKLIELVEDQERQNRAGPERLPSLALGEANELLPDEIIFCELMRTWKTHADLRVALKIIVDLEAA